MRCLVTLVAGLTLSWAACGSGTTILEVTRLQDTRDTVGPYPVVAEVIDADGVDEVTLFYRAGATDEVAVEMIQISGGIYEGAIPGQPAATTVAYYVVATDGDQQVRAPSEPYTFRVLARECTVETDCGPGEVCEAGACVEPLGPCLSDSDCGIGFRCDPASGACLLAVRRCVLDEGCLVGEVCELRILGECIPRPVCSEDEGCPLDFLCDLVTGVCLRGCIGDADCGPGERCDQGACSGALACDDGECPDALACDPVLQYCRPAGAGLCASCAGDADCGGATDYCLVSPQGQYCGRDCSQHPCEPGYSCVEEMIPAQCVPVSGSCDEG